MPQVKSTIFHTFLIHFNDNTSYFTFNTQTLEDLDHLLFSGTDPVLCPWNRSIQISVIIKFDNMYIRFNDVLRKQVLPVDFFQQIGFTTSSDPGYYFDHSVMLPLNKSI